ncbi:response regulator [Phenylobacterium sp.]|uniref:response regulator n=1 Tax=Phenylobacterium sp. TaxID=1871053 RepID=UPI004036EA42
MAPHRFGAGWDQLRRPVWLYDPQTGQKPYANPAALALWGAASLAALADRDFSAQSPAMKTRIQRLVEQTAHGAAVSERWVFFPHGQPVTTQAVVSMFVDDDGQALLLFEATIEDVPVEEQRAAEALRHASTLISLFDTDGTRLFSNPAAFRAYGDMEGDFAARFAAPEEGQAMLAAAAKGAVSGLRAVTTRDGPRWHHMGARPVPDPATGRTCILLDEQDVTLRVEAEIARSAAEQKAGMAEARQQFLTEMSHELRTPLNAVIGFSRLLADADLPAAATDQALRIYGAGLGLLEVVNQMIADPAGQLAPPIPPEAASADVSGRETAQAETGLRALYVDDNENNRALVQAMFATMGFVCETAVDGRAGVEAAKSGDWDVILMDIQMPVMDGVTATRIIRALEGAAASTPIIALTANTLPDQIQTYVEAGMDDCVAKPINMVELLTKVSHWAQGCWRETALAGPTATAS